MAGKAEREGDADAPPGPSLADQRIAEAEPPAEPVDHEQRVKEAQAGREETLTDQQRIATAQAADDRLLRKSIAYVFTAAAFFQIALADLIFIIYAFANDWKIDALLGAWLGATVVQVIAVALVVVKSLFPPVDKASDKAA